MSLLARLLNVLAIPGRVFEEVIPSRHRVLNWLVPVLLAAAVGAAGAVLVAAQPHFQKTVRERQERMIEKQVEAGKMTRAEADRTLAWLGRLAEPGALKLLGAFGALLGALTRVCWWGLVLWLLGRWLLRAPVQLPKAIEIAGLASMILVVGSVAALALVTQPGENGLEWIAPDDPDARSARARTLFWVSSLFEIWFLVVISNGLARLAQTPFFRAAFCVLGYWTLAEVLLTVSGLRQLGF
ncbi:MAG: YIP1 family protein [Verrucomicrobiales bacterium]|nr:YIP1 family protein [Verrucomicrobiales bacterium]